MSRKSTNYNRVSPLPSAVRKKRAGRTTVRILAAVTFVLLLVLLTACDPVRVETQRIAPPSRYLEPTPVPEPEAETVQHLIEVYPFELQQAIGSCNQDKASIREWAADE